jgi:hypothetical protein
LKTPASIVTLVNEFAKKSRNKTGPVIAPKYYIRLAKTILLITEAYFDQ